ncbi:hypothetical protein B5X24_HaOG202731 [Helicoverpa armigera]|uniref:Secreted protein n=1 Tax=Helicoverpa armigera TaxID=29058 RepID=A0A2W1BSD7_HELAM|nr:hypothetical protein B5X24_HaOG202731 [Helicoverpa armigera]
MLFLVSSLMTYLLHFKQNKINHSDKTGCQTSWLLTIHNDCKDVQMTAETYGLTCYPKHGPNNIRKCTNCRRKQ